MKEDMKLLIADTFTQMLEKEDIDKITVTKLIEKCHISRQTFYYHFQDIMDVLEWTFRRATQELAQESMEAGGRAAALKTYVGFIIQHRKSWKSCCIREDGYRLRGCSWRLSRCIWQT